MTRSTVGLGTLLRRLLIALDGDLQTIYDEMAPSFRPRFFPVVQQLRHGAECSVGALAEICGVSQPAMTQTLAEMKAAGLIATTRGADRRARRIRLTETGEAMCTKLEPIWAAKARAAAALDAELPVPLSETVDRALARLAAHSFSHRIKQEISR